MAGVLSFARHRYQALRNRVFVQPEPRRPTFHVDESLERRRAEKAAELEARGVRPRLGRPGGGDAA